MNFVCDVVLQSLSKLLKHEEDLVGEVWRLCLEQPERSWRSGLERITAKIIGRYVKHAIDNIENLHWDTFEPEPKRKRKSRLDEYDFTDGFCVREVPEEHDDSLRPKRARHVCCHMPNEMADEMERKGKQDKILHLENRFAKPCAS